MILMEISFDFDDENKIIPSKRRIVVSKSGTREDRSEKEIEKTYYYSANLGCKAKLFNADDKIITFIVLLPLQSLQKRKDETS